MNLKDSVTKANLLRAFAGESQARNRYNMAASVAKKEGFYVIQKVFDYTAKQEQAHGTVFYNLLKELTDENIEIDGAYPIDIFDTTLKHLLKARHNEYEEWENVYQAFGDKAKEEGFTNIANTFYKICAIEKGHGDRFGAYAEQLQNGSLFKKDEEVVWFCTNCGHFHIGKEAPMMCPVCQHPQGYFIVNSDVNLI